MSSAGTACSKTVTVTIHAAQTTLAGIGVEIESTNH